MRNEGYTLSIDDDIASEKEWEFIPFCQVCKNYLLGQLNSLSEVIVRQVKFIPIIKRIPRLADRQWINSQIAEEFYDHVIRTEDEFCDVGLACVAATARRVESFFHRRLHWNNWYTTILKEVPGKDIKKLWKKLMICYPQNIARHHHIFFNNSLYFQRKYKLWRYAATGAAGGIVRNGFGSLVNRVRWERLANGKRYPLLENLTAEEIEKLPRGSIINLKPNEDVFRQCVRYVREQIEADEIGADCTVVEPTPGVKKPQVKGHSLIYMGLDNGVPTVADQNNINTALSDWMDGTIRAWEFIIAAQWYDAYNIPSLLSKSTFTHKCFKEGE